MLASRQLAIGLHFFYKKNTINSQVPVNHNILFRFGRTIHRLKTGDTILLSLTDSFTNRLNSKYIIK